MLELIVSKLSIAVGIGGSEGGVSFAGNRISLTEVEIVLLRVWIGLSEPVLLERCQGCSVKLNHVCELVDSRESTDLRGLTLFTIVFPDELNTGDEVGVVCADGNLSDFGSG